MSSQLTNRRVLLSSRPKGVPEADHFTVEDADVPEIADGEFLVKTEYWSVDPAMRGWVNDAPNYLPPVEIGAVMRSFAVGTVVASRHADYAEGEVVSGMFGWQRYAVSDGSNVDRKVEETDLPVSLALGVLGLNGVTAYFGLTDGCEPKAGETVVVSTAAGAVGSAVGQIAKIMGCRTVGITGSAEKAALCTNSLGYDVAINYRAEDVTGALKAACPDGIDCYFDNTSGPITDAVMTQLAIGARITICGTVAITDWDPLPVGPRVHRQLMVARARMQGLLILDYKPRFGEAIEHLAGWVREGKLARNEHILDGADAAPGAIKMLYEGRNNGKLLVHVD
ncbi:MAG: NADP-dependent oxidoreductase [Rhodospirillaceae bacterium]|jgi:NADPH-dependent curcumin reductase|nr:NADP-dependent oxidoreductase [Rhodospirillaceae bacterium]MBT5943184.1 NADP-dependent oxidoreductase [Rhodospirillaceae bacterium]MBT6403854.1 NADP-dependent oxidoreductase [Rhodospirillaceae bacterium]MBT6536208.1 NADP-dependent oxidoreductase [Rhodospirillaceae bacterium]MBT7362081.1 NADP-dependent oxidoreductase [Rhodospirillaceae bacterium]